MGRIRVGISGWTYAGWRGDFYPEGLAQRLELAYAAERLTSIEINGSFYSLQRPENYQLWHDEVPDDFVFSVKGPKFITHVKRLRDIDAPLANFLASGIANLGAKLGPILWQLPPTMRFDPDLLEAFLARLPRDTTAAARIARKHDSRVAGRAQTRFGPARPLRHAIEVRHPSFVDLRFIRLLRRQRIAFVIADTAGKWPEFEDVTTDFVYVRLHGASKLYTSGYSRAQLRAWAARIDRWRHGGEPDDAKRMVATPAPRRARRDVFCYFDNTAKEHAPRNARELLARLGEKPTA